MITSDPKSFSQGLSWPELTKPRVRGLSGVRQDFSDLTQP